MLTRWLFLWLLFGIQAFALGQVGSVSREVQDQTHHDEQGVAFFESRIRPVLRGQCLG